jgi:hypothetical protein
MRILRISSPFERVVGTVDGNVMRLAISAVGGGESLGCFTLEHGNNGVVRKCL